jgi:diguanylate cyclase (GGDEF)-like protein/PAS domain S-box-containing protein
MSFRCGLIACASFEREIQAIQGSQDLRNVQFVGLPAGCDLSEASWTGLRETVSEFRAKSCPVALIGGYCLSRPLKELGLDGTVRLEQENPCVEWVAGKSLLDRLLQEGALPVLPGWLRDWERHVAERWPSEPKAAQSFFRDVARKIVLLDTGVYPVAERDLRAFGRFLRLSTETRPVGLEHLRLSLTRLVLAWRAERLHDENAERSAVLGKKVADIARLGRLLHAATTDRSVEETQEGLVELVRDLLAPVEAVYHPLESLPGRPAAEGSPLDRILTLNADHAWTGDRRTLFVRVGHGHDTLGVLELAGFGGPERGENDLDLALTLARVSGLALANARQGRELEEARDRAARAEAALATASEALERTFNYPLGTYRATPQGKILDASLALAKMLGYPDVESLKAVNFWDLHCDRRDRDNKAGYLDATSLVGSFEWQLRRKNGTFIWAEDSCRAAKDGQGRVLFYDGVLEDITARKKMADEHSWVVRLHQAEREVSGRLLSPTSIDEMSSLVLDQARRLTASASGFVGHFDPRSGRLVPAALTPDARDKLNGHPDAGERFHENSGLWRWVLEERRPLVTSMPSLDPRYCGTPDWHLEVGPLLAVPAIMSGAIVGLVVVANPANPYIENDLKAIARLADLYAIAVERTRKEDELREMSLIDPLTGVYNRRGFLTLAEQQMKFAHRTKKEMVLFYADLDDLKLINDSLGHERGDAALVEAAEVLRDAFRESDIVARMGGDEFAVLAIDIAEGKAAALTRRLREKLQARNARPDAAYAVSFSFGVIRYDPERPSSLQDLLKAADRRMYQEKASKKSAGAAA